MSDYKNSRKSARPSGGSRSRFEDIEWDLKDLNLGNLDDDDELDDLDWDFSDKKKSSGRSESRVRTTRTQSHSRPVELQKQSAESRRQSEELRRLSAESQTPRRRESPDKRIQRKQRPSQSRVTGEKSAGSGKAGVSRRIRDSGEPESIPKTLKPRRKQAKKREKSRQPEGAPVSGTVIIRDFLVRLVTFILVLFVLFGVVFGVTPMANADMQPAICAGDLMLYYRLEKDFQSDDVLVFKKDGKQYTGRVVARGGDTVEITGDSQLKVNGSIVVENDIFYSTPQYDSDVTYPVSLDDGQYFILCDSREGAKDSRQFGVVSKKEIKGKVITIVRRSGI